MKTKTITLFIVTFAFIVFGFLQFCVFHLSVDASNRYVDSNAVLYSLEVSSHLLEQKEQTDDVLAKKCLNEKLKQEYLKKRDIAEKDLKSHEKFLPPFNHFKVAKHKAEQMFKKNLENGNI